MSAPTVSRKSKTPFWAKLLLAIVAIVVVGGTGLFAGSFFGARAEIDTQVVKSINLEQDVILLTAGIAGIEEERDNQDFFGLFDIPGSERAVYVRYEFDASFGIHGEDVKIAQLGEDTYRITIPEFIQLGFDDPQFSVAVASDEVLAWVTPEIDELAIANETFQDETLAEHLTGFRPVLEKQAEVFYSNIVKSINPDATIEFVFAGSTTAD